MKIEEEKTFSLLKTLTYFAEAFKLNNYKKNRAFEQMILYMPLFSFFSSLVKREKCSIYKVRGI